MCSLLEEDSVQALLFVATHTKRSKSLSRPNVKLSAITLSKIQRKVAFHLLSARRELVSLQ